MGTSVARSDSQEAALFEPPSDPLRHSATRFFAFLPWLVLAAAVLLRVIYFVRAGGLWGDETMLALNIASRTWRELAQPLDYAQLAPVPFLWAERAAFLLFGPRDHAFRVVSLLAGIAVLPITWQLARAVVGRTGVIVALSLIATSVVLLRYGAELKPYGLDAAVAAAVAVGALGALDAAVAGRALLRVLLMGCIALLLSLPSVFGCAAVILALGFAAIRRRDARASATVVGLALVWAMLFGVSYYLWYRPVASSPYMQQFWEAAFLRPGSPGLLPRIGASWQDAAMGVSVLSERFSGLLLLIALAGAAIVARRRSMPIAVVLSAPTVLAFLGSAAGRYPISTRTILFAAPALAILVGAALEALVERARDTVARIPSRALLFVVLVAPAIVAVTLATGSGEDEDVETAVREFSARAQKGEPVYVYHRATPSWTFYTTDWYRPDTLRLAWTAQVAGPNGAGFTNPSARGPRPLGDGADLVYVVDGRVELLGTASGVQARHGLGYRPLVADAGWVENEVRRIRDAARPTIWLVFADHLHGSVREGEWLVDGVRRAGGTVEWSSEHPQWALYRMRFESVASR